MKTISNESKTVKSTFNDEFENYLKKQQVKTTYNGKIDDEWLKNYVKH